MINEVKIRVVLKDWKTAIELGRIEVLDKIKKLPNGLRGRIKRINGNPIIFGLKYHKDMIILRNQLCTELPHLADIIRSDPDLLDGFAWSRGDYVELYFSHYEMVIDKIRRALLNV